MLYPPITKLLESVNSRYLLVNVIARRARQLSIESKLSGEPLPEKPVTMAINEVARGELSAVMKDDYRQ
ncbi:MAG: DNA-directed RNA polymerase subunit omega [Oscillospiraceae bacterium]|nr:DNA-directed RNA polymerase subunit omega [Oscillospiraceae bacterium]